MNRCLCLATALLLASGCCEPIATPSNPHAQPPPLASAAAATLWTHLGADLPEPEVHWIAGPCIEGMGFDRCIAGGLYLGELHAVWVIAPPEGSALTATALAHELTHAAGVLDETETRRRTGPANDWLRSQGFE
jgi:hypothetical protein